VMIIFGVAGVAIPWSPFKYAPAMTVGAIHPSMFAGKRESSRVVEGYIFPASRRMTGSTVLT